MSFAQPDGRQLRGFEESSPHEFVAEEGCSDDRRIWAEQKWVRDGESGSSSFLWIVSDLAVIVIVERWHYSVLPVDCMGS